MEALQKLISIHSVSGNEDELRTYIFEYVTSLGFMPLVIGDNVVVKIIGKNTKKALLLNSHIDTVAIGDATKWHTDPLTGVMRGNKMYGLGASDEKACVAALLELATEFATKEKPHCDVYLQFVVKEEIDGSGTEQVLCEFDTYRNTYSEIGAILGEPTGLKEIEIAHKGNIFVSVQTLGESGHGSRPESITKHAVLEMLRVVKQLQQLQAKWKKKYKDPVLGYPTLGIATSISAGISTSPNKFPDSCNITCDIRTIPQMHTIAVSEIEKAIYPATVSYLYQPVPYGYTEEKERIVVLTRQITRKPIVSSTWSNDMCFFSRRGIPAVVFGPGEKSVIHAANEYCYPHKITRCVEYYKRIIAEF